MPYRVHLIEKLVQRDDVNDGCTGDHRIVMDGRDHRARVADTLQQAIADAFGDFGLPLDYFFCPSNPEDESPDVLPHIGCNRNEDNEGNPVNGHYRDRVARKLSKLGQLWLADYTFSVQYIEQRPFTRAELSAAFPSATIE